MRVLIVGATSAIAAAAARRFASEGASLFLVGRSAEKLAAVLSDVRARGARQAASYQLDLTRVGEHPALVAAAVEALGGLDAVLVAHGVLPDQRACEERVEATLAALDVNLTSTVSLLTLLANHFERQRAGCIAVITSVAGDRGRQSNYVYGTAKGALALFLEGLRGRLHRSGVAVVDIRPGFVSTPMTAGRPHNALYASADRVGASIHRAMRRRPAVAYVPWFWRPIMAAVRSVPAALFKRLKL